MLVKLTDFNGKYTFFLDCRNIRVVQTNQPKPQPVESRKREDVITAAVKPQAPTMVVTYTMLPNGFQAFDVAEDADEVARAVNAAWQGKSLLVN
jgi:hypothetical protein